MSADALLGHRLLVDWGHGFYRSPPRLAEDDQLLRTRICALLGGLRHSLESVETHHRQAMLPPPSRAAPRHDPAAIAVARALERIGARIGSVESRLRAQPAPAQDHLARAQRRDLASLDRMLACDLRIAAAAALLCEEFAGLDAATLAAAADRATAALDALAAMIAERALALP